MHLQSWLDSTTNILKHFPNISIIHIFHEFNVKEDSLSMRGISVVEGTIHYEYWENGHIILVDSVVIYNA